MAAVAKWPNEFKFGSFAFLLYCDCGIVCWSLNNLLHDFKF
jgi:hypothetical protein